MSIIRYSDQNEFDLSHSEQDCRGWTVVDEAGNTLGTITELLIDTEKNHVDSVIISGSGAQVKAADIALRDGTVIVRGAANLDNYAATETAPRTGTYDDTYDDKANYAHGNLRTANENDVSVPVIEEQLNVGKREVQGGGVRVRTEQQEIPVEEQVTLREEHVHVERTPVNRAVGESDLTAFREGEITLTEHAEVPVVSKEARVVEEVVIGKEATERVETVSDTVRRTEVEVEEFDNDINRRATNS